MKKMTDSENEAAIAAFKVRFTQLAQEAAPHYSKELCTELVNKAYAAVHTVEKALTDAGYEVHDKTDDGDAAVMLMAIGARMMEGLASIIFEQIEQHDTIDNLANALGIPPESIIALDDDGSGRIRTDSVEDMLKQSGVHINRKLEGVVITQITPDCDCSSCDFSREAAGHAQVKSYSLINGMTALVAPKAVINELERKREGITLQ